MTVFTYSHILYSHVIRQPNHRAQCDWTAVLEACSLAELYQDVRWLLTQELRDYTSLAESAMLTGTGRREETAGRKLHDGQNVFLLVRRIQSAAGVSSRPL